MRDMREWMDRASAAEAEVERLRAALRGTPASLPNRAPRGMRTFTVYRDEDVSGVSGTGVVVEGVLFSTGVVVIHWLTPPPWGSLNIFGSWEQFMAIHVGAHPENRSEIQWGDGEHWGPGTWRSNPDPFARLAPDDQNDRT